MEQALQKRDIDECLSQWWGFLNCNTTELVDECSSEKKDLARADGHKQSQPEWTARKLPYVQLANSSLSLHSQ